MGKLIIISGDDDFAVKEKARCTASALAEGNVPESDPAFEIISGDGEELKFDAAAERMTSAMRTPPFLSDHQVIWLRNFTGFDVLSSAYKSSTPAGILADMLCAGLPEEQTVIINGPGLDMRRAFGKALKNSGADITVFNAVKSSDRGFSESRRSQIFEICRESGKKIAPGAVQYLETVLGSNTGTLKLELEKLFCYTGDAAEITAEDCRIICSRTPEAVSWNFTAALIERNTGEALSLLDMLLKQGDAELKVLAAVSGEFQRMIQVLRAMDELGITRPNPRSFDALPEDVRAKNPDNILLKMHPFRAFKTCESAMRFTPAELAANLKSVLQTNRALVTGGGDPRILLERLIFFITTQKSI